MKIIIENEYEGIRIETTPERYEQDIRTVNPHFWKWVSVSYEGGSTVLTNRMRLSLYVKPLTLSASLTLVWVKGLSAIMLTNTVKSLLAQN